jgi:hypothetical protein
LEVSVSNPCTENKCHASPFKAQSAFYEIEMKQKQNRNQMIETLKVGKYKKGNLTKTVNVKKVT